MSAVLEAAIARVRAGVAVVPLAPTLDRDSATQLTLEGDVADDLGGRKLPLLERDEPCWWCGVIVPTGTPWFCWDTDRRRPCRHVWSVVAGGVLCRRCYRLERDRVRHVAEVYHRTGRDLTRTMFELMQEGL